MDRFSNINTLLAFTTVARLGSVSRAAEVLHLTQPAISHQIKRLAADSGLILFRRTAIGVEITADGAALLPKAEAVIKAMTEFQRSATQRAGHLRGHLKIGTVVDPEFIRLGRLLSHLRAGFPEVATELVHGVSGTILDRIRRGQIDAGFYLGAPDAPDLNAADAPLYSVPLAQFSYRVIAPMGWQDRVEAADWPALAALPWIGTPEASAHHRLLAEIFARHDCRQNIVALVDQEASMLEMVRAGVGLSLCRDSVALHERQASGLSVANAVSVPACLSFATLDRRKDTPLISELFGLLNAIW